MTHTADAPGLVIEPGSRWTRLGIAGEVTPASVIETAVARDGQGSGLQFGDDIHKFSPTKEIYTPVIDGVVHDWDMAPELWRYQAERLGMDIAEQPLTLTEEVWCPVEAKAKALECAFEHLGVPLFQLVKGPVCATFASNGVTGIVVQVGAASASVTPVIDGGVVTKAAMHTRFAGDFIDATLISNLERESVDIVPAYQVKERIRGLPAGRASPAKLGPKGTPSFHSYHVASLVADMKRVCAQVNPQPMKGPEIRGMKPYEFPSGFNLLVGPERLIVAEALFKPTMASIPGSNIPQNAPGISDLIYQSVSKLDASTEVTTALMANIVLAGGTVSLQGLPRRIENDLLQIFPNYAPSFHLRGDHISEHGSIVWSGASILASLGSYDGAWATKSYYDEVGAHQFVEKHYK